MDIKTDVERVKEARLNCKLLSSEEYDLTIPRAEALLALKVFKGERDLSEDHAQELYDEMASGRFRSEHVNIATAMMQGELYRINGQHTAYARQFMPVSYQCRVKKLDYEVHDEEELRKLYSVFDPHYSARSKSHLTKVMLIDTEAVEGVWQSNLAKYATAFRFWKLPLLSDRRRMGHNETAIEIAKNAKLFQFVGVFCQAYESQNWISKRIGVMAAMFECYEQRPTLFDEFWKPVADGLGLTAKTDPRYVLREWLMTHSINSGKSQKEREKMTNAEEMYRICVNAWNNWRNGKESKAMRPTARRVRAI